MTLEGLLDNERLVADAFGYWPSFHDAEVHWLRLERPFKEELGYAEPAVEFLIHGWEMTNEVDARGYYVLQKHHLVQFRFEGLGESDLSGFNHQNAILGLRISKAEGDGAERIRVVFEHAHGLCGHFTAVSGQVVSVTPCDDEGRATKNREQ